MPSRGAELPRVFTDLVEVNHSCMKLNTVSYLILYSCGCCSVVEAPGRI